MTLSLSDSDVRELADMSRVIDAVDDAAREQFEGKVVMPPRVNIMKDGTFLRLMATYMMGSGLMGYKAFHGSMDKGVRYMIVVIREEDGEILALVDGAYLTALRTGATSGVGTRYMAPQGPSQLGLIGSGLEAETNLAAVAAVREITSVKVFSRSAERREEFATRMSGLLSLAIEPVATPEEAVEEAGIVVVATNTGHNGPIAFQGKWMQKGQHIVSIGSTSPFLREIDPETFDRADTVVFDADPEQIFEESGDLMEIEGSLKDRLLGAMQLPELVVNGGIQRSSSDITLFKSVGTGAQDIASAKVLYDIAMERGVGREIGQIVSPKKF